LINLNYLSSDLSYFNSGTPASSTTKTGRRDIAEILLKVALNTVMVIHHKLAQIPMQQINSLLIVHLSRPVL
jgi:hypothetical protein